MIDHNVENKSQILLIILVLVISFALHSSLYFILNRSQYNFYDTDTWYSVRQINRLTHGEDIQFDPMINYPDGRNIDFGITLPILSSLFVGEKDTPLTIFNKIGFLPPILSVLFALVVYFLVSRLFSKTTGFYSLILLSIGTGIFFQNCLFGVIDHHLLECALNTILILCLLSAFKEKSLLWIIPVLVSGALLYFTSQSWILYYGVAGFCAVTLFLLYYVWDRNKKIVFYLFILTGICCIFSFWYFRGEYWISFWGFAEPISELSFSNLGIFLARFNVLIPILFFGYIWFRVIKREFPAFVLLLITSILLALTIRFARVEYVFTPFAVILSAWFLDKYFSRKTARILVFIFFISSLLMGAVLISTLAKTATDNTGWNDALTFLQNQDQGVVLSWWDYGHWISSISNQPPFTDPFQDNIIEAARIFTSNTTPALKRYSIRYILVTRNDFKSYDPMVWYSKSSSSYNESFLKKLIEGDTFKDDLIFENSLIRIYKADPILHDKRQTINKDKDYLCLRGDEETIFPL